MITYFHNSLQNLLQKSIYRLDDRYRLKRQIATMNKNRQAFFVEIFPRSIDDIYDADLPNLHQCRPLSIFSVLHLCRPENEIISKRLC